MEEKIKNILSLYLKVPAVEIGTDTVIDRRALANSILVHRLYAHLANENIRVADYTAIKTYGQLLQTITVKSEEVPYTITGSAIIYNDHAKPGKNVFLTGIDIEEIGLLPVVNDFREDEFYRMNFAPSEISYCILQPNIIASFAGLFAVKEAIVKADNTYKGRLFNSIVIDHLTNGKPVHESFEISISHTEALAIGIAIKMKQLLPPGAITSETLPANTNNKNLIFFYLLASIAILLSIISIALWMKR